MINQNIFIINCNPLYEILEEIKENLSFQVIKYKNENEFISKNNSNLKNSLIIVSSTHQLPLNNNLTRNNLLHLKDLPLSIQKIIELINIQLIKLRFNHQSKTTIKNYELDLNSKFISNNNIILKLTEKEIEIILYLNEYKTTHNVLDLQKNIWGYVVDMDLWHLHR